MQSRPYDCQDGLKIWLSRPERDRLLSIVEMDTPRILAFHLGLHGLRAEEIVQVTADDVRPIDGSTRHALVIETAMKQSGLKREPPISDDLATRLIRYRSDAGRDLDEPLIDKSKRRVREWIEEARLKLDEQLDDDVALDLSMHDLWQTWVTDTYYSLAAAGLPMAEKPTMSLGGWEQTSTGRDKPPARLSRARVRPRHRTVGEISGAGVGYGQLDLDALLDPSIGRVDPDYVNQS